MESAVTDLKDQLSANKQELAEKNDLYNDELRKFQEATKHSTEMTVEFEKCRTELSKFKILAETEGIRASSMEEIRSSSEKEIQTLQTELKGKEVECQHLISRVNDAEVAKNIADARYNQLKNQLQRRESDLDNKLKELDGIHDRYQEMNQLLKTSESKEVDLVERLRDYMR